MIFRMQIGKQIFRMSGLLQAGTIPLRVRLTVMVTQYTVFIKPTEQMPVFSAL